MRQTPPPAAAPPDWTTVERRLDRIDPLAVLVGLGPRSGVMALISSDPSQRSFIAVSDEAETVIDRADPLFEAMGSDGPPALTLVAYDAGARVATGDRPSVWPDRIEARFSALLRFEPGEAGLTAIGWGRDRREAEARRDRAVAWAMGARPFDRPPPPASEFPAEDTRDAYRHAVADVVDRIASGELFQANLARAWSGLIRSDGDPLDVFLRLVGSDGGATYAAYWRTADRALVSASPELFLDWPGGEARIAARPIKGTRPRDPNPDRDAGLARDLRDSAKDRAENLMIVDLMRNDLSRVCVPGSVAVEGLWSVESHPRVHHLVSTVTGDPRPGLTPAALLAATFPPGSITGAPKHQAMRVIAGHEPPRGPWCGSLIWQDGSGGLTASVLIRTAAFTRSGTGWTWRAQAGAGIVADSVPDAEADEVEVKIAGLKWALSG